MSYLINTKEKTMNNTNIITIEKNVPVPSIITRTRDKYMFLQNMVVGDSFVINGSTPDFSPDSTRNYVYAEHSKKHNRRYTIRTLSGHCEKPTAIRVWRVA